MNNMVSAYFIGLKFSDSLEDDCSESPMDSLRRRNKNFCSHLWDLEHLMDECGVDGYGPGREYLTDIEIMVKNKDYASDFFDRANELPFVAYALLKWLIND